MGCPPDPFEVSLWRYSDESQALGATASKLLDEVERLHPVVTGVAACLEAAEKDAFLADCGALVERLRAVDPVALGRRFTWEDAPNGAMSEYPDFTKIYKHVEGAKIQVRAAEMTLCELRDRLLKAWAKVPERMRQGPLLEDVNREREAHRLHRLDDRRVYLEVLGGQMDFCRFKIKDEETTVEQKRLEALHLKMLEEERKRVLALTEEDLLADRTLFFELPELPPEA